MAEADPKLDALLLGPGTSLYYFSGLHWWLSERLLALIIFRNGEPLLVSPAFEEGRARESLQYPVEIRVWQEDQNPTELVVRSLADRGLKSGRIGIDEALPFTFYDHLKSAGPTYQFVSGDPVTIGCRAVKSESELALMRLACEATCDIYRAVFSSLRDGLSQHDIADWIDQGFAKMDLRGESLVLIGSSAALPHGSKAPQTLKDGSVLLIDGGCTVNGYNSDVSRTGVLGKPSHKVQQALQLRFAAHRMPPWMPRATGNFPVLWMMPLATSSLPPVLVPATSFLRTVWVTGSAWTAMSILIWCAQAPPFWRRA